MQFFFSFFLSFFPSFFLSFFLSFICLFIYLLFVSISLTNQITVGDYLLKINGKFVKGYDDAMSR